MSFKNESSLSAINNTSNNSTHSFEITTLPGGDDIYLIFSLGAFVVLLIGFTIGWIAVVYWKRRKSRSLYESPNLSGDRLPGVNIAHIFMIFVLHP